MAQPTESINTTLPVVLGFFATLCACLPGGMAAIALAMNAKDKERRGDIQGAKSQVMYSYIVSILSLVIGIPLVILYIFLQVAAH